MNLRQRRGLMFLGGSAVFLVVGASSLSSYVSDVNAEVGDKMDLVVLDDDLAPYTPLTDDDVDTVEVPERWAPEGATTEPSQVIGMVATTDLEAGTYLTETMLEAPPTLTEGEREIAILIDAETGVAGKVDPGSRVDIVATFAGEGVGRAEIIVADALVIDVGDLQVEADDEGLPSSGRVVPITFALSVEEALILTHAESFAQQVRLALIPPGDEEPVPPDERVYPSPDLGDDVGVSPDDLNGEPGA